MSGDHERGRLRSAWRSRDFRLLAISFVIDGLGSWAYMTVVIVYVFERTDSTTWIALITASRWLPSLVVSSYAGVLADRYERTRLMIVSALLSFVVTVAIGVVVAVDGPLALLLILSAVSAVIYSPYRPAAGALTPELVPERDLTAANGLVSALESLVVVIGPGVGAVMLAIDAPAAAIFLDAATFLVAAALVQRLRTRSRGDVAEEGDNAFRAFTNGLSALRAERIALVLVLFCALDSAVYGASTVLYVPLSEQLGTGSDGFGYLLAGMALGGVISAGLANRLSSMRRLAPIIVAGITCQAVPFGVMAFVHEPAIGFVLQVIAGTGMIVVDVLAITALQRSMARGVLGRVLSLLDVAVVLSILVSSFLFAALLGTFDLRPTLFVLAFGFPVVAVLCIGPVLRADRDNAAELRALEPRIALLSVLDLFEAAPRSALEQLARAIEVVERPAKSVVVREGDPADALWIIFSGETEVGIDRKIVRTLGPRDYFGEIGLLHGIPRIASVRTTEPSVLWRLSGEDFLEAVQANRASTSLLGVAASRLARTHARTADESASVATAS